MRRFKKIDLIVQSILMAMSLTVILLPLLGTWQIISALVHTFTKKLSIQHKIYIIILLIVIVTLIVYDSFSMRSQTLTLLIFFGYALGVYYLFLSYLTLKK